MRILLAEDDRLLGDGIQAGLRALGFQVDWVRDGFAAERELRAQAYSAMVLDLTDGGDGSFAAEVALGLELEGVALPDAIYADGFESA